MRKFLVYSAAALLLVACDSAAEGEHGGGHGVEFHMGLGPGPAGAKVAHTEGHDEHGEHGEAHAAPTDAEAAPAAAPEQPAAAEGETEGDVAAGETEGDVEGETEGEVPAAEEGEAAEADPADAEAGVDDAEAEAEAEAAPEPAPAPGNATATVKLGSNKIDDTLDANAVRKVVRKNKDGIESCYATGLAKNGGLAGKVTVEFYVDKKGKTDGAKVKSSDHGDASVDACIVEKIGDWKFDAPSDGGKAKVKYIFDLSAE